MHRFRDKDLRLSITAVLLLTLVGLRPLDAKSTAKNSQQSRAFTEALAEARRLADTDAGRAYQNEFGKIVAPRLGDIVGECTKNLGPTVKFQVVFVFAANGQLEQVLGPKDQPAAKCVGDKFRDLQLPAPPHANWPVALSINISPENAPRLLAEALRLMETGTWEVDATISCGKKMRVHGLLAGNDSDLNLEPEDRNAVRQIAIKDQVWASFDGSKTWKPQSASEQAPFRRVFAFVHNPLRSETASPALQVVKQETHDGDTWMQLRPKKSDKKKPEPQQTEYWIAISQDLKRNGVRRYEGPVTEPGHEKEPLHCVATYQPANNKTIQAPASAAAFPEETSAPSGSPDAKFAADNLKYSRDFYSKVHFVAIANLSLGSAGTAEFKYDRYPNGGPERIQCDEGEFARKNGKTWLKSNDWGDTGKPVDATTSNRLNNWVGLIDGRLNAEPALKFVAKRDEGERDEVVFEEAKNGPGESPRYIFDKFKNEKDDHLPLLSEFSGPMRLGGHEATVKIQFSYLVSVQIQETEAESPTPPTGPDSEKSQPRGNESVGELVNRGIEKAKAGDLDGAIADFTRASELNPKDDAPYYNRAQAKWLKKDAAGAIADYTRAIELGSTNPAAYNNRGNARAENNDNDGAIADYTRAIELNPNYARAYYNRSVAKQTKGDTAGAKADLKTAKKLDPGLVVKDTDAVTVEDLFNRAGAKKAKGDLDGAIADYTRAIQLSPKEPAIYNNRGLAKAAKGDPDGAIADFNRTLELKPKDPAAYINRGNAKRDKRDLDGAIADYTHAIKLDPRYTTAYYSRGLAKKQKNDLDGAIADYNHAIQLDPKFARAYCDRGVAKRRKGDLNGAIADYNRTIELDPKYAIAYGNRANAKGEKGDLDGAIADYTRGIELNPKDSKDYSYRADAHAKKKQYAAAINDEQKAIELDPKNGDYYLDLGWYQLFNRKPREAIAASLKALELSPDDAVVIKTNLAHGYLFDNQFDKAKAIYLENKNAKLHDGRAFSQAVLDDFKEFLEAGITHPDMEKIKALLTTKTDTP
jgi:tetratricopeptide (TPR) repeat protein